MPGPTAATIAVNTPMEVSRTGRLETFFTSAARYSEGHGVSIGMPTAAAERRLDERLVKGCEENIYLSNATADLTIAFSGGTFRRPSLHVTGGHVYAFVLHSHRTRRHLRLHVRRLRAQQ